MNQVKSRLAALALLDRAVASAPDDELAASIGGLSDDLRESYHHLIGARTEEGAVEVDLVVLTRQACSAGRMDGTLERVGAVLSDACLSACIEKLGDDADNPSEDQLRGALPELVEAHGLGVVRVMLASAVTGEAQASPLCIRLLKKDEVYALPAVEPTPVARPVSPADDEERAAVRERRKGDRQRKQAEQRARREQAGRSRKR